MQKSITSFFGAPKEGAGPPLSPAKKPASSPKSPIKSPIKSPTKAKPKPKAKPKAKPKPNANPVKTKTANAAASASSGAESSPTSSPVGERTKNGENSGKTPEKILSPAKKSSPAKTSPVRSSSVKRKKVELEREQDVDERKSAGLDVSENAKNGGVDSIKHEAGKVGKGKDDEVDAVPKSKRLRRLAKTPVVEDSDDDMFGEGKGDENEKPTDDSTATAMDVENDQSRDNKQKGKKRKSKGDRRKDVDNGDGQDEDDEEEEEVYKEEEDEDDEDDAEDDGDDDDEDGDSDEELEDAHDGDTVRSTLMAAALKKPITSKKKVAKGAKAAGITMEKTEDLVAKAIWKKGQPVPFEAIADVFNRIEQTTKRLEIQEILRGFLCTVITLTPEDLVPCVYLACNEVAPAYESLELGIGDAVLMKAIQGATGRSAKDVKAASQKAGDLGEVAQHSTKAQGTLAFGQTIKTLSARQILEEYRGIARVKGSLSQDEKIKRIKKMLVSCKGVQAKYIIRGLQGKMRIGLSSSTVMVSLSYAAVTCPSEAARAAEKSEQDLADRSDETKSENVVAKKTVTDEKDDGEGTAESKEGTNADVGAKGEGKAKVSDSAEGICAENGVSRDGDAEGVGGDGEKAAGGEDSEGLIPVAQKLREANDMEEKLELGCQVVKQAYSECPNLDLLIKAILSSPLYRLQQLCQLTPGVPVFPMLAKPTKSIGEVLQRLSGQEFTCEYKYDGVRAQVHLLPDGNLRFFSRNSKDSSSELPDLIPVMKDCAVEGVTSYVIDTEVVAYDRETGNLLPFQMLSTRGRKDVDATDVKVKVIVEAFDILYVNGESLLQSPLKERRKRLRGAFKEVEGRFRFATSMDHKEDGDTEPIEEFLSEAVKGNCEGLMVKTLTENASYEPSKRSLNWLKLKKDYLQADGGGVGDSLDLVPIAAYLGKGKRTGKYGAYLLACYDQELDQYQSVCKIGTGFKDEELLKFWTELKEHTVETRPNYYNVADSLAPDVWLQPKKVWEVKCADLSKSPVHRAAIGKDGRGISIRFPRLLRERDDKDPEQATSSDQILDMYESQDVIKNNAAGAQAANDEDDWEL